MLAIPVVKACITKGVGLWICGMVLATGCDNTAEPMGSTGPSFSCEDGEVEEIYNQRIAPLLATQRPKSCNNCHLSGIDLSLFQRDTPCQTMACLQHQGLVDLSEPAASTILKWIARAQPDSELITQEVIAEEYAGFLAWIEQSATCESCPEFEDPCGDGETEVTPCSEDAFVDPGDCSAPTREALFRDRVYAWRDRCYPCHFDNKDNEGPNWIVTGSCNLASLQTMRAVQTSGYIDLVRPEKSLLLQKPLAQSAGGIEHGGHDKFASTDDQAYRDFLSWIEREASCTP